MAEEATKNEEEAMEELLGYIGNYGISEEGYSEDNGVNEPKLAKGMIPVYYDSENKVWRRADENNENKQWYNYEAKQWANIVTVSDENADLREAEVGTEIPMEDITTFFVWIPRYAYSITSGYKEGNGATGKIDVTFLKGNTNIGADNVEYKTDYDESSLQVGDVTPKIVHPGFKSGSQELTGIWVAKFEASGINEDGEAAGNASATSSTPTNATGAYVRILPSQISWRHVTVGESEYQSMRMAENTEKYGWGQNVNSHLIKNSEWGAVAYLCYSDYGVVPKTNGAGSYSNTLKISYDIYTGAGAKGINDEGRYENFTEETYGYNTELGILASTTGNEYGIYDMAGGSWERVAAYLDNGNPYLDEYGKSASDSSVVYIENGKIKSEYANLWETYEVSEEEKNNQIKVGDTTLTQDELWDWNKRGIEYNEARYRLTEANFNNMPKGIGINETTTEFSYYAPYKTTGSSWSWYQTIKDTSTNTTSEYGRTWDSDYTLIGNVYIPFIVRSGYFYNGSSAGVLNTSFTYGDAYSGHRVPSGPCVLALRHI